MKSYKDLKEEILNEGGYRYPGDDMTMKELKIAINAAKNILDMLEDGASIQRWQISAIVVASEELASVCTSMRADYDEEMEDEDEYENEVVAYEYPWMGEEVEHIDEISDAKKKEYIRAVDDKGGIFRKPRPGSLAGFERKKEKALAKAFKGGSMQDYVKLQKKSEKRAGIAHKALNSLKKEEVELGEAKDYKLWDVNIGNNYKKGSTSDFGYRPYPVLASSKEEAKKVVLDNADAILKDLITRKKTVGARSGIKITDKNIGTIEPGEKRKRTSVNPNGSTFFSPSGPMNVKLKDGVIIKEEVEQLDEISKETKAAYLKKAPEDHYQMFTGRKPGTKQKLDKRRAAIQKVSKELTGKKHFSDYDPKTKKYTNEEVELEEVAQPKWRVQIGKKHYTVTARNTVEADRKAKKLANKDGNIGVGGKIERINEEMDFKVSVEGLPDMYVKAKSPTEVKQNLRKIVKKPDMIQSVDRVTQSMIKKIFRDKAAGKEEMEEASDVDESSFVAKAAHAKVAGKKSFSLKGSDKKHPVTIGHDAAKKIKKAVSEEIVLDEASHYIKKVHTAKGPEWAVIPKGKVAPEEVFKSEKEAENYIREKGSK